MTTNPPSRTLLNRGDAVFTLQLFEILDAGLLDWSDPSWFFEGLDYNPKTGANLQHDRFCKAFNERFRYREIGMLPFKRWKTKLLYKLKFEIFPKYRPIYQEIEQGLNMLAVEDEYEKSRDIQSSYPETLLSGNSDYLSSGEDHEHERITQGNSVDMIANYLEKFQPLDVAMLDELECMFVQLRTSTLNYR